MKGPMPFCCSTRPFLFSLLFPFFACSSAPSDPTEGAHASGGTSPATGGSASTGGSETGAGSATSASGGHGNTGSGGMTVTGSGGDTSKPETPPWPARPGTGGPIWMRARNLCPFTLWVNSNSGDNKLLPTDVELPPGEIYDFDTPSEWPAARVTAYKDGPGAGEIEKAEMTVSGGQLNYNVTYVDWVGLPMEIVGVGGDCNEDAHTTGCYAPLDELLEGCPEPLLTDDGRCLSPRSYCWDEEKQQSDAFCKHLDSAIAACADCPTGSTFNVYACNGPYQEEPRLCAALNRGMAHDPDNKDPSAYYQNPPYNEYAKWSQSNCPGIYSFSYDDANDQGGFRSCQGDELRITFCPGG